MSEKLRRLQICVTIVLIVQVMAGILLISMTASFHRTLAVYLVKSEKQTLLSELSNIYLQGFELIACYSAGFCICRFVWKNETYIDHIRVTAVWNGACFLIVICGLVHVWFLYTSIELLQNVVESSLFEGMDLYFSNPTWKLLWDEIQYQHECCGVNGYDDWKDASWMPDEESKCETISGPGEMMLIPYACCKRTATSCFQNYAPHLTAFTVPNLNSSEINSGGCFPMFVDLSARYYLKIIVIMLSVLILQILLLILEIIAICIAKRVPSTCTDFSEERPLVVVKYPRNVRCITVTDDDNLDDVECVEEEVLQECRPSDQGFSGCQEYEDKRNIFVH